jgi:hypothetical protein
MHNSLPETDFTACPACGRALEDGYILGKHNRIRWSASAKGMTIFHGVPLLRHEKGFWHRWQWWFYAPSIPAARCPRCHLVMFSYNNDAREEAGNERRVSLILAAILIAAAIAVLAVAWHDWSPQPAIPWLLRIILGIIALLILLIGLIFMGHAARSRRFVKRNRQDIH